MSNQISKFYKSQTGKDLTNVEIVRGIGHLAGGELEEQINLATETSKGVIRELAHANLQPLMSNNWAKEGFLDKLIQVVASQVVKSPIFKDPLAIFKKEGFDFGGYYEEIFTYLPKGIDFDAKGSDSPFQTFEVEAESAIHRNIIRREYPASITKEQFMTAFLNDRNFNNFVNAIFRAVQTANEIEEFENVKSLLVDSLSQLDFNGGQVTIDGVEVDESVDGFVEDTAKTISNVIKNFTFPNKKNQNNIANIPNPTQLEDIYFIVNSDYSTEFDFMLANAFNMDKATIKANTVLVDEFETFQGQGKYNGKTPIAFVIAKDAIIFDDIVNEMDYIWDPHHRKYNIFYHHHYLLGFSPFENAKVIYK